VWKFIFSILNDASGKQAIIDFGNYDNLERPRDGG